MSQKFNKFGEQILQAGFNLLTDDIRAMLVLSAYTFDATDEFVSDLGAVDNGRTAALAGKSVTNGIFDANDSTLTATAGSPSNAIVLFRHTGVDATARLVWYIDVGVGIPFTPEAAQVCPIVWDNGADKIFKI
jgi:hypothetical protein